MGALPRHLVCAPQQAHGPAGPVGSMCTRQGHTGWLSSTAGPGCPRAPVGRLGRTSDHHRGLVNFRPVPSASSALRIIPPLGGPLMPGPICGRGHVVLDVFKACDGWSVPNARVHSWLPWVLPALPVGTRVPRRCELKGWFQAESVCLGDRRAPWEGERLAWGGPHPLLLISARTTLLPVPGVGRQGPFLGHLNVSSHRSLR